MKPSYIDFEEDKYLWKPDIDYRQNPHLYHIGKGQQGVLTCQPYKSEICPYWRFKTSEIAKVSAEKIYSLFLQYLDANDFVGADLAKKYLHMGFTRSRRYANHKSGKKWNQDTNGDWSILKQEQDWNTSDKAKSAEVFKVYWQLAKSNEKYLRLTEEFKSNN